MEIAKTVDGGTMTVALEGRLDSQTVPQLEKEMKEIPADVKELVFDLAKLEYVSSAGLRTLLSLNRAMDDRGSMKLMHVNELVDEIFEVTGVKDILQIE